MNCPNCGAPHDSMRMDDYWNLHAEAGVPRDMNERHPKDEHVWYVTCENCDTMLANGVEAESGDEVLDALLECNHTNRTNELEMARRPSDHLDTYIVYPVCDDCGRIWSGAWASVDKSGTPEIA